MRLSRLIFLTLVALGATGAQAQWRRAESPNFIVYAEGSEGRLRERILLLEDFDRLLRIVTNVNEPPAGAKLHVYFVEDGRALRRIRPLGEQVAGVYIASPEGIAALVSEDSGAGRNEVLFHEYAHHFMRQHAPASYPAWYVEGFAEYFSTARFTSGAIDIGNFSRNRAAWLTHEGWLPLERVLGGTSDGLTPQGVSMFYSQSWLLTHYFFSTPERQQALGRYLALARSSNPVAAIEGAMGMDAERMGRELSNYIRDGSINYRRMRRASGQAAPQVTVTTLPAAAGDLMLHAAALRVGIPDSAQATQLQSIRAAAARHYNDPFARRTLAHAELLHGDRAVAARLLESLIAEAPGDAELMYLRGRLHLEAADDAADRETELRQARLWFSRAHEADGEHFQTLYRYAQALQDGPEARSENTANIMMLAHELAPQVTEIRFAAAGLMLQRGENGQALTLLAPLVSDPHDRSVASAARRMMAQALRPGREEAADPPAAEKPKPQDEPAE